MEARNDSFPVVLSVGCKATRYSECPKFIRTVAPNERVIWVRLYRMAHLRGGNEAQAC